MKWVAAALTAVLWTTPADATPWEWRLPPGFPPPPVPADNPMSVEKVELGRRLFHDPRLSGNGTVSCASCHFETLAFSDGRALSPGATGQPTHRNAPGLLNLAWMSTYTWANPALSSLERQAEVPLFGDDPVEMGVTDANRAEVLTRLSTVSDYPAMFRAAFPQRPSPMDFTAVIQSLAAFQRSLVSPPSRYDRFVAGQDELGQQERQGMALFFGEGGCAQCHGDFNFSDHVAGQPVRFHDAAIHGVSDTAFPNRGLFELTGSPADRNHFRAPSLRHIAQTAPYMHDGRYPDLKTVLFEYRLYAFTEKQIDALVIFLKALGN